VKWLLPVLVGTVLLFGAALAVGWCFQHEENERGAREWEATVARLRAAGQPVEFQQLIPPAIPDNENLGAIPLFQLDTEQANDKSFDTIRVKSALKNIQGETLQPSGASWMKSQRSNQAKLNQFVADRYAKVFPDRQNLLTPLDQFDALCPAVSDLRVAAAARPQCRFQRDYTSQPPYARPMMGLAEMLALAKVMNLHAILALQAGNSPLALQDIEATLKIDRGLRDEPTLIAGLVAMGVLAIQMDAIWQGLDAHVWNDQQLAELQDQLQQVDFMADYQLSLRGEALLYYAPTLDYMRDHRESTLSFLVNLHSNQQMPSLLRWLWSLLPEGWYDMAKARGVSLYLRAAVEPIDLANHRVYVEKANALKAEANSLHVYSLPDFLLRLSAPSVIASTPVFCEGQFRVDAARIAIMLERYRLARGSYPQSLDLLAPGAGEAVPRDLINGQPYHYRLRADGTYLLYSVGWNEVDDGGKPAYRADNPAYLADNPKLTDREHGDWVWPPLPPAVK